MTLMTPGISPTEQDNFIPVRERGTPTDPSYDPIASLSLNRLLRFVDMYGAASGAFGQDARWWWAERSCSSHPGTRAAPSPERPEAPAGGNGDGF